ncbi:PEGA domain-containing protein [Candidatus Woesebacteria bacterium]|nr:PEGA domain-containing protein [Candidatus Woesebacteria bacterium]
MKKLRIGIILIVLGIIIVGVALFLLGFLKPESAGLLVESVPAATVFIDGEQVGRTTYEATRKPGEIVIKLIPQSLDEVLVPFETKVTLTSGIKTVIKREFGDSEETSSGEILSFEKIGGDSSGLAIVSLPNAAQISIDGATRGFAPYKTSSITPGEHKIVVSAPGYSERVLSIKTVEGFKLTVVVKLAPNGEEILEEEEEIEEPKQIEVEILSTSTGFLRVRSEPSILGEEVGRVEPGEHYPYLDKDEDTGWLKIEYEEGKEGWVSGQYAKKMEESKEEPSPSPSP